MNAGAEGGRGIEKALELPSVCPGRLYSSLICASARDSKGIMVIHFSPRGAAPGKKKARLFFSGSKC